MLTETTFGDLGPADIRLDFFGSYAVYPSKAGYSFSPILYYTSAGVGIAGISVGRFDRNFPKAVTANFTPVNSISGSVSDSAGGVSGVTITLSGRQSSSVTTDVNGNYSFVNLPAGSDYTVTPSKTTTTFFTPSNLT